MKAWAAQSTEFLFAKLHGRWSRAWSTGKLLVLLRSLNQQSLARVLKPLGVNPDDHTSVQKQLAEHLVAELASIVRLLPPDLASYYRHILDRYTLENIKIALHARFAQQTLADAQALLVRSPHLPELDLAAITSAKTVPQLFQAMPELPFRDQLLSILRDLDASGDLFGAESRLDQAYFGYLREGMEALDAPRREPAAELIAMEVDILNLIIVLRNQHLYKMRPHRLAALFLPGGLSLDQTTLAELAQLPDPSTVSQQLHNRSYAAAVAGAAEQQLYQVENALWNILYRRAHYDMRQFTKPYLSLIAFPWLKRFESLNLARVFEGVRFKLSAGEIASMLIGAPDV